MKDSTSGEENRQIKEQWSIGKKPLYFVLFSVFLWWPQSNENLKNMSYGAAYNAVPGGYF